MVQAQYCSEWSPLRYSTLVRLTLLSHRQTLYNWANQVRAIRGHFILLYWSARSSMACTNTCTYWRNSDFANSEHKHKHKHKRKSLFKISAAWPSFTLNTTWLQPMPSAFHGANNVLIIQYISIMISLNENCAIPYEYIIKQCLVIDNTHFFSYYVAWLFRKLVLN